jgi:translation initiation factor 1
MPKKPSKPNDSPTHRVVYQEFGSADAALERAQPDLPPNQQSLRIQTTRKGRGGKTVSVINGFQASEATLTTLLKQLKAQCGSGGTIKDETIEIQGDHAAKLLQLLTQKGYKAKISGG